MCYTVQALSPGNPDERGFVVGTDAQGVKRSLLDTRTPALYTGNFGNCLEHSAPNIDLFDAAYYADNMTVLFHVGGSTTMLNESVMSEFYNHCRLASD